MDYVECPACALAYTWYKLNGLTTDLPNLDREYTVRCVCKTEFDVTPYEVEEEQEYTRDWRWMWMRRKPLPIRKHLEVSLNIRTE